MILGTNRHNQNDQNKVSCFRWESRFTWFPSIQFWFVEVPPIFDFLCNKFISKGFDIKGFLCFPKKLFLYFGKSQAPQAHGAVAIHAACVPQIHYLASYPQRQNGGFLHRLAFGKERYWETWCKQEKAHGNLKLRVRIGVIVTRNFTAHGKVIFPMDTMS